MTGIRLMAILLLVAGALAFVIPVPHREDRSIKIGDARVGVETSHSEKLPPAVGAILIAAGVLALALGSRRA